MKATLLALFLLPCVVIADEERSLGRSPDGKFELLLRASTPDDYGWVVIKESSSGAIIETETSQGYSYFPTDDVRTVWREDSRAFAVTVQGTRTTQHTDVYFKDEARWEKVDFPPFIANILGRQGVFAKGRYVSETFGGFVPESRFMIICDVEPDRQQKEEANKFTDWKPSQQTEWKVVLEYHTRTGPNSQIVSIDPHNEKQQANKTVDSTATRVTPPAEQEPRHGQP